MRPREKVLLLNLACGHTRMIDRREVPQAVEGSRSACEKCNFKMVAIKEQQWVERKEVSE